MQAFALPAQPGGGFGGARGETSSPTIGGKRIDAFARCGRYDRWRDDFDGVDEVGVRRDPRYRPDRFDTLIGPGRRGAQLRDSRRRLALTSRR